MTLKELNQKISEANDPTWFTSAEFIFAYKLMEEAKTITGLSTIYRYITEQIEGWEIDNLQNLDELTASKKYYERFKGGFIHFVDSNISSDKNILDNQWGRFRNDYSASGKNIFPSESSEAKFLVELLEGNIDIFKGAYRFFTNYYNIASKENFIGYLLAYEFSEKNKLPISKRIKSERASLNKFRNDFTNSLSEADAMLIEHLEESKQKLIEQTENIKTLQSKISEHYNTWHVKTKAESEEWYTNSVSAFAKFDKDAREKVENLENAYGEVLKLKKPAAYWKKRADKLKREGNYSRNLVVLLVCIGVVILFILLVITPEGMLLSVRDGNESAIKWSIVYIMLISFLAYGIRITQRIAFSSFHLARDAEEREQLTYVYLSLIKESELSGEERRLVMQSLFSRADSGLLKEDSSPTMPNDLIGKIFPK